MLVHGLEAQPVLLPGDLGQTQLPEAGQSHTIFRNFGGYSIGYSQESTYTYELLVTESGREGEPIEENCSDIDVFQLASPMRVVIDLPLKRAQAGERWLSLDGGSAESSTISWRLTTTARSTRIGLELSESSVGSDVVRWNVTELPNGNTDGSMSCLIQVTFESEVALPFESVFAGVEAAGSERPYVNQGSLNGPKILQVERDDYVGENEVGSVPGGESRESGALLLRSVLFSRLKSEAGEVVVATVSGLKGYRLYRLNSERYVLLLDGVTPESNKLLLPQFAPATFQYFKMVSVRTSRSSTVIDLDLQRPATLSPYLSGNTILVKSSEE